MKQLTSDVIIDHYTGCEGDTMTQTQQMRTECPYCKHKNTRWVEADDFEHDSFKVVLCGTITVVGCGKPYVVMYKPLIHVYDVKAIEGVRDAP